MKSLNEENISVDESLVKKIGSEIKKYERECFYCNETSEIKEIKRIIERLCK